MTDQRDTQGPRGTEEGQHAFGRMTWALRALGLILAVLVWIGLGGAEGCARMRGRLPRSER
jgi:hypothetical protein